MKTTITIFLSLFTLISYGQKQLEFNQVKLVSAEETVPVDKVWKIESVLSNNRLHVTNASQHENTIISVNGTSIYVASRIMSPSVSTTRRQYSQMGGLTYLPFWLPENSTLEASTNVEYISVIEFNILN